MSARPSPTPRECAVCGAAVPRTARACPECGADERTGWRESDPYDGVDLPDSAWADDDAPPPLDRSRGGLPWYWLAAGLAVLLALVLTVLGLR